MNRINYFFVSLLFFGLLSGKLYSSNGVRIEGRVMNAGKKEIFIVKDNLITREENELGRNTLDTEGNFSFEINLKDVALCHLKYNNDKIPLFLLKGSSYKINFDASDLKQTLMIFSPHKAISYYLLKKDSLEKTLFPDDLKAIYSLNITSFDSLNDFAYKVLKNFYKNYFAGQKVNKKFNEYEELDQVTFWANKKTLYPNYHAYFVQDNIPLKSNYYHYLKKIKINKRIALESSNCVSFLDNQVRRNFTRKEFPELKQMQIEDVRQKNNYVLKEFENDTIKEFFIVKHLLTLLELGFVDEVVDEMQLFKRQSIGSEFLIVLTDQIAKLATIKSGRSVPSFTVYDKNNKAIDPSNLIGKIILINIWSAHCPYSVKEWSFLNKIQAKLRADSSFVFLNVSLEEDITEWGNFLQKNNYLHGISAYAKGGWNSSICEAFLVKSTPRFILIYKHAIIVDPYAPRPSTSELISLLEKQKEQ